MNKKMIEDYKERFKEIFENYPKVKEYLSVGNLDKCYDEIGTNLHRCVFTAFLLEAGINPINHITKIWWGMYSHISALGVILGNFVIPDHITSIENFSFDNDYTLTKLKVGKGVTEIDPQAFRGCIHLEKVELPKHLKGYVWKGNPSQSMFAGSSRYTIEDIFGAPLGAGLPAPEIIYY